MVLAPHRHGLSSAFWATDMNDVLLTGDYVFLSARDVRRDWAVLFQYGRVSETGPIAEMRRRHAGIAERGGQGCAILPGLINAHHHCYGVELVNQAVKDDFLEPWMFNGAAMVDLSPHISTAHAAVRLLRSGVTSVVDMCSAGASRSDAQVRLTEKARAYQNVGLRAAIAPGERWQNRLVHGAGEEARFYASLPETLRQRLKTAETERRRLSPDEYFDVMADLSGQGTDLQQFWFGPTGPQWTPDEVLRKIAREAERLNTRIQTHALESHYESIESPRVRGTSVLQHLDRLSLLSERLSLAHVVWATEGDIALVRSRGVQISHNPSSNLRLRSGIAPAPSMVAAGVCTALGMDGTSLAGDEDMFAEMRLARNLGQPPHATAPALTAVQVLEMATSGGAELLGRDDLGQLHPGFCGDALILDMSRMLHPWSAPDIDPVELIVGRAKACDVRDVLVDGTLVLQDGDLLGIDEQSLMDDLRSEMLSNPQDAAARALQQDLRPYVMGFYADWDVAALNSHRPATRYGVRPDFQLSSFGQPSGRINHDPKPN